MKNNKGLTLVEVLAVIVVLSFILLIAVPKVLNVITDAKKGTLETTARMIANSVENKYMEYDITESTEEITCDSVANLNDIDFELCLVKYIDETAHITIIGKGRYEGLNVCNATKESATATNEKCVTKFDLDDWETIIAAVQEAEEKGTPYPYDVGEQRKIDLGSLGEHTIRVANTTPCDGSLASQTACGFVLEFADIITTSQMKDTNTNAGGWPETIVREYLNSTLLNELPEKLKNGIIDTKVVSSHGDDTDENFESKDKLYLLSTREVWGGNYDSAATEEITRQLDYYAWKSVSEFSNNQYAIKYNGSGASNWWLRSAYSNAYNYYRVSNIGTYSADPPAIAATNYHGVSPAFRIGKEVFVGNFADDSWETIVAAVK